MPWIENLIRNVAFAARQLRAEPSFALGTMLTLALGIGATTATFSALNAVLFRPLPYPSSDRILSISDRNGDGSRAEVTFGTFRELAERTRTFESLAVYKGWKPTLTGVTEPERLEGQCVSADYFRVLGVMPSLGFAFNAAEDRGDGPRRVILSHRLWQGHFGGDPALPGRTITLDGSPYTVVGVMPPGFENATAPNADLWTLLQYDLGQGRAWGHHLNMVGRLRTEVPTPRAIAEVQAIARGPVPEFTRAAWASLSHGLLVTPLKEEVTRGVKPTLFLMMGAVALLMLIACVNVTNLLLARAIRRKGEFALRKALGAGSGQLLQQLLAETLVMAGLGGLAGLGVALAGIQMLLALFANELPRASGMSLDGTALAFAFGLTTVVGLALGLAPTMLASRQPPQTALQISPRSMTGGRHRLRRALIVAEVALALVLLVGSGLLLRSTRTLLAVHPGFDPTQALSLQLHVTGSRYKDPEATRRYFEDVLDATKAVPGVSAAGFTSQLPLSGDLDQYGISIESSGSHEPGEVRAGFRYAVSPGFLETMGIPLRKGRFIEDGDRADAPRVAVISESMARRCLTGPDPIGQRLVIGTGSPYTVVGVVGDVKQQSLALKEADAVYVPQAQWRFADRVMSLVVRTPGEPTALTPLLRRAIRSVDGAQAVVRVATLDSLVARSASERQFALKVLEVCAVAALALAAAGIYGVLASSVAERKREFGVRSALGASPGTILRMVLAQGLGLVGIGLALGLVGAVGASRMLGALLFEISPLDPVTYGAMIALLAIVSLVSCSLPAWRAAQVDPATALRNE